MLARDVACKPKVIAILCHPVEDSLNHSIFKNIVSELEKVSDVVKVSLYDIGFNPIMDRFERGLYHNAEHIPNDLSGHLSELESCDALAFVFPTWNGGPPAMLKGYFDRLFKPGVSFTIDDQGNLKRVKRLGNVRSVLVVNTHGGSYLSAVLMGDYSRKIVTRWLKWSLGGSPRVYYYGIYNVNKIDEFVLKAIRRNIYRRVVKFAKRLKAG